MHPPTHPSTKTGLLAGYRDAGTRLIAVDYTHPTAVNPNAKLYARHKLDFVMVGLTGKGSVCLCVCLSVHCGWGRGRARSCVV